ncbi:putative sugar nucleotidyl transferase [Blattabacterium cuenoti]|uniref:putative sugar nucleotidyl transferase n=1 Tax=Blattabacterium cuenoti TaxID=1653831 RepID=UPI001EEA3B0A|nr:putative sugar nucleotidyl transferase [Blattabacterium cuenoti]
MNFILYDDVVIWKNLLPLTFTRPISEIRFGILTIKERWEKFLGQKINEIFTIPFLQKKFSLLNLDLDNNFFSNILLVNSSYIPNIELIDKIFSINDNEAISFKKKIIAIKKKIISYGDYKKSNFFSKIGNNFKKIHEIKEIIYIKNIWDFFIKNSFILNEDYFLLTKWKKSYSLLGDNLILNKKNIFLEDDIKTNKVVLDANSGPIYIEKQVDLMEGTVIKGPVYIGKKSIIKIGTKIYGGTTISPFCKIGGEIKNSIFFSYSNKVHDGFIGDSIVGEWCNLGAGTNISNLRNDYCKVTVWNYKEEKFISTNVQFFGIIMGDHSKSSINTQFNTATIIGVGTNIFGYGFPPRYIPSFSLGGIQINKKILFKKLCETAEIVMKRRNKKFSILDKEILEYLYNSSYNKISKNW